MTSVLALLLVACGDVARPTGPAPTPTEPIIIASEGVPGAAGLPLGPYTPGSDVSIEVRTNESINQLVGLLAELEFIDWDSVLEGYEAAPPPIGETVPPSVAEVAGTAATGPLGAAYAEWFGSADWLRQRASEAIAADGAFAGSGEAERAVALRNLLTIELPLVRALVAADAGERLTEAGDLDPWFGAPHEWDRLWAILYGTPALSGAMSEELLAAVSSGATASMQGNTAAARDSHDLVRRALLRVALQGIATSSARSDAGRAAAYLRGVEPLLARVDPRTTDALASLLAVEGPLDTVAISEAATQLAGLAGVEGSFVAVES